ncbi:NrtA/SsuA/CpmA family ABC transporter substrate-binding protein [Castellaniella sp. GW247-6E4]|uniref:ABC transporter substrate-binding protein n=1 Tax=Castellaniella sp. GW247-6E4 TaxID=3140380 RepID=UPI003315E47A
MNTRISRRQLLAGGAGVMLLGLGAVRAQKGPAAVRFADNPSISWPQPYIATRDGLWQQNGIDVSPTSQRFGTGQSSLNTMLQSDEVHMAVVAETPITLALIAGMPLRIVTGLSSTTWYVSTKKSSNIKTLKDLAGHRLGVAVGTSAEYFMDMALSSAGLTQKDVQVINVKPTDMVPALSGGSLDAFFIWDPFRFEARRILGDEYVELSFPDFRSNAFLVTKADFVEKHRDMVAPILKSLIEANQAMEADPAASASYMAGLMGINPEIAAAVWKTHRYDVALRHDMVQAFENYGRYVVGKGIVPKGTKLPDFQAAMLADEMKAVDPARLDLA